MRARMGRGRKDRDPGRGSAGGNSIADGESRQRLVPRSVRPRSGCRGSCRRTRAGSLRGRRPGAGISPSATSSTRPSSRFRTYPETGITRGQATGGHPEANPLDPPLVDDPSTLDPHDQVSRTAGRVDRRNAGPRPSQSIGEKSGPASRQSGKRREVGGSGGKIGPGRDRNGPRPRSLGRGPESCPGGDQSPFSSTRSTVPLEAGIVARPVRPGPTPRAGTVTSGAPEELPALTVRLATVKGRRFSIRSVVLLGRSSGDLGRDEGRADRVVEGPGERGGVDGRVAEESLNATWPSGAQSGLAQAGRGLDDDPAPGLVRRGRRAG